MFTYAHMRFDAIYEPAVVHELHQDWIAHAACKRHLRPNPDAMYVPAPVRLMARAACKRHVQPNFCTQCMNQRRFIQCAKRQVHPYINIYLHIYTHTSMYTYVQIRAFTHTHTYAVHAHVHLHVHIPTPTLTVAPARIRIHMSILI